MTPTAQKKEDCEEVATKSSCRRKNAKPKVTPSKENMEPPALPFPKSEKPKSKPRNRRKLCSSSLHPALDEDEVSSIYSKTLILYCSL